MGSARTWGSTQGCCECCSASPSCCHPSHVSGLASGSFCQCSPCAHQPGCRSRPCPRGCSSPQGFAVVGAATGCLLPVSARQTSPPAASQAVSAKFRAVVVSPQGAVVARAWPWGCALPTAAVARAGLPACSLEGPGSCPCLRDTQHTDGLSKIKPSVPSWQQTRWQFGGREGRGRGVKFSICSFLSLVMSFMGKPTDKSNMCASF